MTHNMNTATATRNTAGAMFFSPASQAYVYSAVVQAPVAAPVATTAVAKLESMFAAKNITSGDFKKMLKMAVQSDFCAMRKQIAA